METESVVYMVCASVIGFFTAGAVLDSKKTARDLDKHKTDTEKKLGEHKLHVSDHYVKVTVFNDLKQEQINSSNRLHQRIDETDKKLDTIKDGVGIVKDKMFEGFTELRNILLSK